MSHSSLLTAGSSAGGKPSESNQIASWKDKHYLIIDDFQGMRQLLREALRSLGARYVDQAGNGGEAMTMLAQSRYDVVLCDYLMGDGKNGQQVLEEAKVRDLVTPSCVWIMVSAEKTVESVMGAAEHQPDAYLIKPITEEVLLSRLNRIWNKKQVFKAIDQAYRDKDYLKAAKLCETQIAGNKIHVVDLMRMKAKLLLKAGEFEMAREMYERVLAQREFVWAKAGLANIRMKNGEYGIAKSILSEVIAENNHYLEAYDYLAAAHRQLGEYEEESKVLERAVKLSPNSVLRQRNLGEVAMRLDNPVLAERAFRKCLAVGVHSVNKTPDAYLGLARVCGQKNEPKEALELLATLKKEFPGGENRLRAKITEGMVYHESGDYRRARMSGDELGDMLTNTTERPDVPTCLEMARLMFAVGVKEPPVELLKEVVRNNHDNDRLLEDVQGIFENARLGFEGADIIASSRKEASDLMNQGVLLWKTGKLPEAVEWMRGATLKAPTNMRLLFNCAQIMISHMQKFGFDHTLAEEALEVLLKVDKLQPGQQRFAQLMETLSALRDN